jgi:hypothetical protein
VTTKSIGKQGEIEEAKRRYLSQADVPSRAGRARGAARRKAGRFCSACSGRITFTPRADWSGYDFDAPTRYDQLFRASALSRPRSSRTRRQVPITFGPTTRSTTTTAGA